MIKRYSSGLDLRQVSVSHDITTMKIQIIVNVFPCVFDKSLKSENKLS